MTGYTRNDTTNNIADGNIINASDLDGEFDAIQAAFDDTTGHTHDGTVGGGAPIEVLGPTQDVVVTDTVIRPKTDNTVDIGSTTLEFKNLYLDGTAQVDTLQVDESATITANLTVNGNTTLGNAATDTVTVTADVASHLIPATDNTYDLGASTDEWRNLYIDGTAQVDTLQVDESATITADLTVNGNTTLGNADTDTLTLTAQVATSVVPSVDDTVDLGSSTKEWRNLFVDGTANIDSLVADTADINGGTIDGATIGGSSAAAGTFTTATATTGNITTVNATTVDTTNLEVTTLKAKDGTAAGSIADATGVVTLASSVLTTTDINGGTIDGATIATSDITVGTGKTLNVSAGTLTLADNQISGDKVEGGTINAITINTLGSTTGNITTVNATTVDTTNIEVTNIKAKDGTASATIADSTGVMTVASAVLTTADINGGTIDGTTIGGSSAAAGTFTTATATTGNITTVNATTVDTTNLEVTTLKAKDGTSAGSISDATGVVTLASSVLTTTDINGGTIDGAVIGGSSAAAGTFTTVTASGDLTIADKIVHSGDTNTAIRFPAADTVTVETSGAERVRVDSSGNVGIGTAAPAYQLDVSSTATTLARFQHSDGNVAEIEIVGTLGATTIAERAGATAFDRDGTERMRIDASGNVGIGNTAPSAKLMSQVNTFTDADKVALKAYNAQSVGAYASFQNSATGTAFTDGFRIGIDDSENAVLQNLEATNMLFATSGTERMRIDSSGNVGVGTSAPQTQLEISANNNQSYTLTGAINDGVSSTTAGTVLTVSSITSNAILIGDILSGSTTSPGTRILSQLSGTTGGVGTYTVSVSQLVENTGGIIGRPSGPGIIRITDTDTTSSTSPQTIGALEFFTSDISTPGAGVGAYVYAVNEGSAPDTSLVFGTRNDLGGGVDANERMRIDSLGHVGIGIRLPVVQFHVRDSIASVAAAASNSIALFENFDTTSTASTRIGFRSHQGDSIRERAYLEAGREGTSGGYLSIWTRPDGNAISEKIRVTAAGNVGIGTATPAVSLQVNGTIRTESTTPFIQLSETDTTDQNFGLRLSAGNTILEQRNNDFSAVTAEYMRLTSAGDVSVSSKLGIGTTFPATQLHVSGTTHSTATFTASITGTTMNVTAVSAGTLNVGDIVYGAGGIAPITKIVAQTSGTTGSTGDYTVSVSQTVSSGTVYAASGTASKIRISDTDASVTANQPQGTIEFFGSDSTAPGAGVGAYIGAISESGTPDSSLIFGTRDAAVGGVDANERMRITSSGNVGVGTNSPGGLGLTVAATPAVHLVLRALDNTSESRIWFGDPDSDIVGRIEYEHNNDAMAFWTTSTERMRIDSSGNVGIGTISPQSILQLRKDNAAGLGAVLSLSNNNTSGLTGNSVGIGFSAYTTLAMDNASYRGATIVGQTTAAGNAHSLLFSTSSTSAVPTERMRIDSSGNVGIGNTAPVVPLHVTGSTMTTGVVYQNQPAQTSKAAAATLTIAELLTGIIQYTGAADTLTLPTGTNIEGGLPATFPTNMSFDVSVINTGSGTVTIAANGNTTVGGLTVTAGASGMFRVRKTATNTYTVYRIS